MSQEILDSSKVPGALARGELKDVYETINAVYDKGYDAMLPYENEAITRGFDSFDEMVSFYSIDDRTDDALGHVQRDSIRGLFQTSLEGYDGSSEYAVAVQNAGAGVMFLVALRASTVPLVFSIVFVVLLVLRGHIASMLGLVIALAWFVFEFGVGYRHACFLRRSYGLFHKYGVHLGGVSHTASKPAGPEQASTATMVARTSRPAAAGSRGILPKAPAKRPGKSKKHMPKRR